MCLIKGVISAHRLWLAYGVRPSWLQKPQPLGKAALL